LVLDKVCGSDGLRREARCGLWVTGREKQRRKEKLGERKKKVKIKE
jgi:hypothetical protein